jgi:hypothetical protein
MKTCNKCGVEQPLENFYKAAGTRDGHRGECRACFRKRAQERYPEVRDQAIARAKKWREDNIDRFRDNQRRMRATPEYKQKSREYHLNKKYGLTPADYERMLAEQGGGCAICGRPPRDDISLHVDHDHATGAIRGLTCFRCNNALGDFDDDLHRLEAAVEYLELHDPEVAELTAAIKQRAREMLPAAPPLF